MIPDFKRLAQHTIPLDQSLGNMHGDQLHLKVFPLGPPERYGFALVPPAYKQYRLRMDSTENVYTCQIGMRSITHVSDPASLIVDVNNEARAMGDDHILGFKSLNLNAWRTYLVAMYDLIERVGPNNPNGFFPTTSQDFEGFLTVANRNADFVNSHIEPSYPEAQMAVNMLKATVPGSTAQKFGDIDMLIRFAILRHDLLMEAAAKLPPEEDHLKDQMETGAQNWFDLMTKHFDVSIVVLRGF